MYFNIFKTGLFVRASYRILVVKSMKLNVHTSGSFHNQTGTYRIRFVTLENYLLTTKL